MFSNKAAGRSNCSSTRRPCSQPNFRVGVAILDSRNGPSGIRLTAGSSSRRTPARIEQPRWIHISEMMELLGCFELRGRKLARVYKLRMSVLSWDTGTRFLGAGCCVAGRLSCLLPSCPPGLCRPTTSTGPDTLRNGTKPITRIPGSGPPGPRPCGRKWRRPGAADSGLHVQLLHNTGLAGRKLQVAVVGVLDRGRLPRAQQSLGRLAGAQVLVEQRNRGRGMAQLLGKQDKHKPALPRCLPDKQQQLGGLIPAQ